MSEYSNVSRETLINYDELNPFYEEDWTVGTDPKLNEREIDVFQKMLFFFSRNYFDAYNKKIENHQLNKNSLTFILISLKD